jgi:hypothetical protein
VAVLFSGCPFRRSVYSTDGAFHYHAERGNETNPLARYTIETALPRAYRSVDKYG